MRLLPPTRCSLLPAALLPVLLLAACPGLFPADDDDDDDSGPVLSCEGPRKQLDRSRWWVVNGTRQPTLVPLSDAQRNAVVSVWNGSGCSGTLIAPRVVLTAQHCTQGLSARDFSILFGEDDYNPIASIGVSRLIEHSSADLSLLQLAADATEQLPVEPIPIHVDPLDSSWVGERVEAAGYGQTSPGGSSNGRFFVAEPIYAVSSTELSINGEGIHGVCFGDSGGPVMGIVPGGAVRVLGALSWGDSSCTGIDHYTRVDPFHTWVEALTGPTPPVGPVPCGDTTAVGRCEAELRHAVFCAGEVLQRVDCNASGQVCGWDAGSEGYRCIAPGSDPCDGTDGLGECDGTVSRWCYRGSLQTFDCAPCEMACAWVDDATGYDCVADPCRGLDYLGRCDGDTAEWCNNGSYESVNCREYGQTCGWIDNEYGYYCQD